jgi:hypothetical protein
MKDKSNKKTFVAANFPVCGGKRKKITSPPFPLSLNKERGIQGVRSTDSKESGKRILNQPENCSKLCYASKAISQTNRISFVVFKIETCFLVMKNYPFLSKDRV